VIEVIDFGSIIIDGMHFSSDLIIYPDGQIKDNWWRGSGHTLAIEDITDLIDSAPETIVAGTGIYGRMRPGAELEQYLRQRGIAFFPELNQSAKETYNRLSSQQPTGACFHLTC
jgi:hypothetical protein